MSEAKKQSIAVLGGTGKEGGGLALRWAHAGHPVYLGSRDADKAREAADAMRETLGPDAQVEGMDNASAAAKGEIVCLAVPHKAQMPTATACSDALAGKIVIDVTVPLVPPKVDRVQLPDGKSAVETLQTELGGGVRVVSAFQNISASHLTKLDHDVECDVLVCADDPAAADHVVDLAEEIGLTAWNVGPLANSVVAESLTSALIALNKRYKVPGSGIRITGIDKDRNNG